MAKSVTINQIVTAGTKEYAKKFVFISQVKIEKGILLILEAFKELSNDFSVDIYGPIIDLELTFIKNLTCYKGIIDFDDVYDTLDNYDMVLLPTFQKGEGYPGIIIEAYSMSLPVITTEWNSIPEIVQDGVSGLLIEPRSVKALKEAILKVNKKIYSVMNSGAYEMSKNYQSDKVHEQIVSIMQDITKLNFN